jgi:acyl-CoA thioester hydrolase
VRVRYAETDRAGVGYHANTFVWFECARTELLRSLGAPYRRLEEEGWLLTVTEAAARFLRSVRYDDRLVIDCAIVEAAGARLRIEYEVRVEGELCTTGSTELACLDAASGRPRRLPPPLVAAIGRGGGRAEEEER